MRQLYLLLLVSLAFLTPLQSQTFNGAGGNIPDDGSFIDFEIVAGGLPSSMNVQDFGLETVCLNLTHSWVADLAITLVAPDGTTLALFSSLGGDTDGFVNTCLSSNASSSIFQQWYPFTGTFRPFGDMGTLNNQNINPNGVWKLRILDTYAFADAGELLDWSITFGNQPCVPFPFESSDLPIIKISTGGTPIINEPKIDAFFQLIDNGPGNRNFVNQTNFALESNIGIEVRGFSSQGFPKKSYSVELRDALGEDREESILGMPKTSDYALQANFSDKTLMRNALAYEVFRQLGNYATRTRFCEMVLDGAYQGVYILTEKVKRGKERVDIAKLTESDTSGLDLTGGYILLIDRNTTPGWSSQYSQPNSPNVFTYFQHIYPKPDEIQPVQAQYIQSYVDSFEVALKSPEFQDTLEGWRRFAHEKSFMDYLILNEISKNVDGYRLSTFFHKDRDDNGGKLTMGPTWDYDLAWYNADYCENFQTAGWAYDINYICGDAGVPFWWERLYADSLFAQNLACRWQYLRENSTLQNSHLYGIIDSMALVLQEAQGRNFLQWPILGTYVWPNPGPLPDSHLGEVAKLKNWLNERMQWIDFTLNEKLPTLNAAFTATALNAYNWQFQAPAGYEYQWDFGDGNTANTANPQHQFAGPGVYNVRLSVTTPYGCSADSQQIINIVNTGTKAPGEGLFQVSPNPARDQVRIVLPQTTAWAPTVQLINTLGQTVLAMTFPEGAQQLEVPLGNVPKGVYHLSINTGKRHEMVSLVVE